MKPSIVFLLILTLAVPLQAGAQELASLEQMRQAAEKGNADAQLEMGILYEFGYNMPKNHVTALAWYLRAADQGNALAAKRRDLIQSGMKPEEVEAARKQALELAAPKPPAAVEAEPAPAEPAPAPEAPLAGPPNIEPSSTP